MSRREEAEIMRIEGQMIDNLFNLVWELVKLAIICILIASWLANKLLYLTCWLLRETARYFRQRRLRRRGL